MPERLHSVLSHTPIALLVTDAEGRVTSIDGRGPEIAALGLGPSVLGRPLSDVAAHLPDVVASCRRAMSGHEHTAAFTHDGRHYDGRFEPVREGERVTGVVAVLLDVTEREESAAAVSRTQSHLAEIERLAVLGSLAGGIAHQVNGGLTGIRLTLGRLTSFELSRQPESSQANDERQHRIELLQDIREGVDRIERIARELRGFAQAESAPVDLVDVDATVDAVIALTAHEIRHRATLVVDHGHPRPVPAREPALRQVVLHLVLNAVQAITEGSSGKHQVRVVTRSDDAGRAIIEVADTGGGIPAEQLRRIFDPFFTTRAAGQGLGLGLSVARDIVLGMGGQIIAESEVGKGTIMRVLLPTTEQPERAEAVAAAAPAIAASAPPIRVLIVDDDRPVAAAVALALDDHDVVVASSGREAIEILRRDPAFDVVLCDLMMPEMSGMEVFAWVKPVEPKLAERFVFMTGGAFTPRAERFLAETDNPCIDKPFDAGDLRELVARVAARGPRHG